jgi:hypothetical protein
MGTESEDPFKDLELPPVVQPQAEPLPSIVSVENSINEAVSTLQASMERYDAAVTDTLATRQLLSNKFLGDILSLDMKDDPKADALMYQAKSKFIAEYRGLLNDIDNANRNHVGIKLKQKDLDNQQQANINAAELLRQVKLLGNIQTTEIDTAAANAQAEEKLEDIFEQNHMEVLDTEIVQGNGNLPELKTEEE